MKMISIHFYIFTFLHFYTFTFLHDSELRKYQDWAGQYEDDILDRWSSKLEVCELERPLLRWYLTFLHFYTIVNWGYIKTISASFTSSKLEVCSMLRPLLRWYLRSGRTNTRQSSPQLGKLPKWGKWWYLGNLPRLMCSLVGETCANLLTYL